MDSLQCGQYTRKWNRSFQLKITDGHWPDRAVPSDIHQPIRYDMYKPKGFRVFLYIVLINLHNILVKHLVLSLDGNKWKLQNNWNFSKSTKHKSVENCWITPKIQLQLETLMKICIINFTIATSAKEMKKNCLLTDRPTDRQQ